MNQKALIFWLGPFAAGAVLMLNGISTAGAQETSCGLAKTTELLDLIDATIAAADDCYMDLDAVADIIDYVGEFVTLLELLKTAGEDSGQAIDRFNGVYNNLKVLIKMIPKLGKVVDMFIRTLAQISSKFSFVVNKLPSSETLEKVSNRIDTVETVMDIATLRALYYTQRIPFFKSNLEFHRDRVIADDCEGIEELEACSTNDLLVFQEMRASFETCSDVFGAVADSLDPFDFDWMYDWTDVFDGISEWTGKFTDWLEDFTEDVASHATYALCCYNVLRDVREFTEVSGGLFNLLTCPVSGAVDELVTEGLEWILEQLGENPITQFVVDASRIVSMFDVLPAGGSWVSFPNLPDNEVPDMCISDFVAWVDTDYGGENHFELIENNSDEDQGFGDAVAAEFMDACDAAEEALFSEKEDCCDIVRVCNATDKIVLYEGNDCTQNIAGTLSVPELIGTANAITKKAGDQQCTANDEARSVKFFGPLSRGVVLAVSDNSDNWCTDDYASIVLTQELGDEDELCVGSFQLSNLEYRKVGTGYVMYSLPKDGLDGKVSRFYTALTDNPSTYEPPLCSAQSKVMLFEGNSCTQTIVGKLAPPATGATSTFVAGSSTFPNDQVRSVALVGPMSAGFQMEVFDNSEQTCGDDYGSIVLTQSLAAWETLCVSTFEQDKTATKYQQEFFKLNGLDGKISSIILKNTGNVNNNDYNRCHTDSSAIFLEGNSCTSGGIVKSVAFPSAGQHSKITGYSNDAARSVLLTGPLTRGKRLYVADNSNGLPFDDVAIIVLEGDMANGEKICVPSFHNDGLFGSKVRVTSSYVNGLDGKVSQIYAYTPTSAALTINVMARPKWSPSFSEENGGYSVDTKGPIVGLWVSTNWGDNKRVLYAGSSSCIDSSQSHRWTSWFSEEQSSYTQCNDNEYVSRMQCKDSRCDNVRLGCMKFSSRCKYVTGSTIQSIQNDGIWIGDEGRVLWKVKCEDSYCGRLVLGHRKLQYT